MKIEQKHFDAMMNKTKCKFWDDDKNNVKIGYLECLDNEQSSVLPFRYRTKVGDSYSTRSVWCKNCEPLKPVKYVKEGRDILKALAGHDYEMTPELIEHMRFDHPEKYSWTLPMWDTCGKPVSESNFGYEPEWLEEREI